MTTRKADAVALVQWAQANGAEVRRSRRGWVIRLGGRQIAVVHLTPSVCGVRKAKADVARALRSR